MHWDGVHRGLTALPVSKLLIDREADKNCLQVNWVAPVGEAQEPFIPATI
jgi:hypothetical protein